MPDFDTSGPLPHRPRVASRRSVLGLGVLALGLSACLPSQDAEGPDGTAGSGPLVTSSDEVSGWSDTSTVSAAALEVQALGTLARSTGRTAPGVGRAFVALHRSHLSVLEPGQTLAAPTGRAPADAKRAVSKLARDEAAHLLTLQTLASRSSDPALARALASMAAGVAQLLAARVPAHQLVEIESAPPLVREAPAAAEVQALQDVLAGTHAALFVLGVVAARARAAGEDGAEERVTTAWREHREVRDALTGLLQGMRQDPVAAAAEYRMPGPVGTSGQRSAVAIGVHQRMTALWAHLVGSSDRGEVRNWAMGHMRESAVREFKFGGNPVAFPGADELTNR